MKRILVILSIWISSNAAAVEAEHSIFEFSLLNLQNNEFLVVDYGSQGCFHGDTAKLTFDGESVAINSKYPHESDIKQILSLEEHMKLEKYFTHVDSLTEPGGCTTTVTMNLMLYRNGELVKSKKLVDDTCGFGGPKNLLSPESLYNELVRTPFFEKMKSGKE